MRCHVKKKSLSTLTVLTEHVGRYMRSARHVQAHGHAAHVRRARGQSGPAPQREIPAVRLVVVRVHVERPPGGAQAFPVCSGHVGCVRYHWVLEGDGSVR